MNRTAEGHQLYANRSESVTNKVLENRAADPRDDLRDEDEDEYRGQQSHDEVSWQNASRAGDRPLFMFHNCLTLHDGSLLLSRQ